LDRSYGEIAAQLRLAGADAAEKLVRAAKARLRERFRGVAEHRGSPARRTPGS